MSSDVSFSGFVPERSLSLEHYRENYPVKYFNTAYYLQYWVLQQLYPLVQVAYFSSCIVSSLINLIIGFFFLTMAMLDTRKKFSVESSHSTSSTSSTSSSSRQSSFFSSDYASSRSSDSSLSNFPRYLEIDDPGEAVSIDRDGSVQLLQPGDWVRALGGMETLMAVGGIFGTMNTVQAIWIKSEEPIVTEDVERVIIQLARRTPQLQLCLGRSRTRIWFRRMKKLLVDFESSSENVMVVFNRLLHVKYDLWHGPLWCARLVHVPCQEKYKAALIFSVQHTITDGTTNMSLCREAVSMLGNLMTGEPLPVSLHPVLPSYADHIKSGISKKFFVKYFLKKFYQTLIKDFTHKSSFKGSFSCPTTKLAETRIIRKELSQESTKKLIERCKEAKVSVNSCIVAAMNMALFQVAQRASPHMTTAKVNVTNCVNTRRYYQPQYQYAYGCHISLEEVETKITPNDIKEFWGLARRIHQTVHSHIETDNIPLKLTSLLTYASMIYPINYYLTKNGKKNITDCHYITTNMGDLRAHLPSQVGPIEIVDILRSVTCETAGNPFMLTFHTFRGKFMMSMDYFTNKIFDKTAKECFETAFQHILSIAETGKLDSSLAGLNAQ